MRRSDKTVWDGVYTDEQSRRGQQLYGRVCAGCHLIDLSGDDGPALRGSVFFSRWGDKALTDLFLKIAVTMPQNASGSLKPAEYIDIVSFLLKNNDAPAGTSELPADLDQLDTIQITAKPTQR